MAKLWDEDGRPRGGVGAPGGGGSALPALPPDDDSDLPVFLAITIRTFPSDPSYGVEIQHNTTGTGSGDHLVSLIPGVTVFVDERLDDGNLNYYRSRHIAVGFTPGAWTVWSAGRRPGQRVHDVRHPPALFTAPLLSSVTPDAGIIYAGMLQDLETSPNAQIKLSGSYSITATNFINMAATGNEHWISSTNFHIEADGDAVFGGTLSAAAGTFGIITAGILRGTDGEVRLDSAFSLTKAHYIDLTATGPSDFFIKHAALELVGDGSQALFKGVIDVVNADLTEPDTTIAWSRFRGDTITHPFTDLVAEDVVWTHRLTSSTVGGVSMYGFTESSSAFVSPIFIAGMRGYTAGATTAAGIWLHAFKHDGTGGWTDMTSTDVLLAVGSASLVYGSPYYLTVYGGGGIVIGAPTGGNKGNQTLNVEGTIYIDGVAVGTGGVSDHGLLTGLGDDDHSQYIRSDAADITTGALQFQGTSSPQIIINPPTGTAQLRVYPQAANVDSYIRILRVPASTVNASYLELGRDGGPLWQVYSTGASGDLKFRYNATEVAKFSSTGEIYATASAHLVYHPGNTHAHSVHTGVVPTTAAGAPAGGSTGTPEIKLTSSITTSTDIPFTLVNW